MTLTLTDFALVSLATWYLAYMATTKSGPLNVFGWMRTKAHTEDAKAGSLGEMLGCIYCAAPYWAALVLIVYLTPARPLVYPFAIAGAALMAHRFTGGMHT